MGIFGFYRWGLEIGTLVIWIRLKLKFGFGSGSLGWYFGVSRFLLFFFLRTEFISSALFLCFSSFVLRLHFCLKYLRMSRIFRGNIILQFIMKKAISRPIQINPHTSILLLLCRDVKNTNIQLKNSNHISLFQFKKLLMLSLNGRYFTWYFQIQKNNKHKHTT